MSLLEKNNESSAAVRVEEMDGDFSPVSEFKVVQSDLGERESEVRREEKYLRLA